MLLGAEFFPFDVAKCIFKYCTTTCLRDLSYVSALLRERVGEYKLGVLKNSFDSSKEGVERFRGEVLPDVKTDNLNIAVMLYLYSRRHLKELMCSGYVDAFNTKFESVMEELLAGDIAFRKSGDCYELFINSISLNVFLCEDTSIFILIKLIEWYIECFDFGTDNDAANRMHEMLNYINYICKYKSRSMVFSWINKSISNISKQIENKEVDGFSILVCFIRSKVIDLAGVQNLVSWIIEKFKDFFCSGLMMRAAINFLDCAMEEYPLELKGDEFSRVKDYMIEIFKDTSLDIEVRADAVYSLRTAIRNRYLVSLEEDELSCIKDNVIAISMDASVADEIRSIVLYGGCEIMRNYSVKLSKEELSSIKNCVIGVLKKSSVADEIDHNIFEDLCFVIETYPLELDEDELGCVKDCLIGLFKNSSIDFVTRDVVFDFLYVMINRYPLVLNKDEINLVKDFAIRVLKNAGNFLFSPFRCLGVVMKNYSLNLNEDELDCIKNGVIEELSDPFMDGKLQGMVFDILYVVSEKYSLKLSSCEFECIKGYVMRVSNDSSVDSVRQDDVRRSLHAIMMNCSGEVDGDAFEFFGEDNLNWI